MGGDQREPKQIEKENLEGYYWIAKSAVRDPKEPSWNTPNYSNTFEKIIDSPGSVETAMLHFGDCGHYGLPR